MKPAPARMPLCLRAALLALSIAAMLTQVSRASAAADRAGSRLLAPPGMSAAVLPSERTGLIGFASPLPGPRVPGSGALLIAGLIGGWAIGRRRLSAMGSRSLDPHRSGHR